MSYPEGYRITKAAIAGLIGETAKDYEPGWYIKYLTIRL